ncbi:MAG: spore coat protein U domain-containing protein [Candidatus Margulisiibacteriota bacterium]
MKTKILLLIGYLSLLLVLPAYSATFNLTVDDVTWTASGPLGYDPYDNSEYTQAVNIELDFEVDEDTDYIVTFTKGSSTTYTRTAHSGINEIEYNLLADPNKTSKELRDFPDVKKNTDVLYGTVSVADISPLILTYYAFVPRRQDVLPGDYTDTFTIKVYSGTVKNPGSLHGSAGVNITIPAQDLLQLALGPNDFGEAGGVTMNFGDVAGGEVQALDVKVRSNRGYRLFAQSVNNQTLVHVDPGISSWFNFFYSLDNITYDLTGGGSVEIASSGSKTNQNGDKYTSAVSIGDVTMAVAGDYSDTIIYTVSDY